MTRCLNVLRRRGWRRGVNHPGLCFPLTLSRHHDRHHDRRLFPRHHDRRLFPRHHDRRLFPRHHETGIPISATGAAPVLPQVEVQNVVAHTGSFNPGSVLGDTNSGALLLALIGTILNIGLEPAALETEAGRALIEAAATVDIHARPLIDFDRSEFVDDGEVRIYQSVWLQSIIFKTALRSGGWLPIFIATGGDPGAAFGNLLPTADTLFL